MYSLVLVSPFLKKKRFKRKEVDKAVDSRVSFEFYRHGYSMYFVERERERKQASKQAKNKKNGKPYLTNGK